MVKARNKASRELARCYFLRKSSFFLPPHARQAEKKAGTMVAGIYSEKRISRLLVRRSRKRRKTLAWPRVERIRNYGRRRRFIARLRRTYGFSPLLYKFNNKRRFPVRRVMENGRSLECFFPHFRRAHLTEAQ